MNEWIELAKLALLLGFAAFVIHSVLTIFASVL